MTLQELIDQITDAKMLLQGVLNELPHVVENDNDDQAFRLIHDARNALEDAEDLLYSAGYSNDDADFYEDSMDGDHASGLASAGFGTDEDYGYYVNDEY